MGASRRLLDATAETPPGASAGDRLPALMMAGGKGDCAMRVEIYDTKIGENGLPVVVKEKSTYYPALSRLNSPQAVCEIFRNVIRIHERTEENLWMACMDTAWHLKGLFLLSRGTADSAFCQPRDICMKALLCGAVSVIIAHNHPSGEIAPSNEDIESAKRIRKACETVGLVMADFVIVGEFDHWSFSHEEKEKKPA